jgi:hypothetical protein
VQLSCSRNSSSGTPSTKVITSSIVRPTALDVESPDIRSAARLKIWTLRSALSNRISAEEMCSTIRALSCSDSTIWRETCWT